MTGMSLRGQVGQHVSLLTVEVAESRARALADRAKEEGEAIFHEGGITSRSHTARPARVGHRRGLPASRRRDIAPAPQALSTSRGPRGPQRSQLLRGQDHLTRTRVAGGPCSSAEQWPKVDGDKHHRFAREGRVRKKVAYAMDVAAMGMPGSRGRRVECYGLGNWVCITGQASFRLDTGEMVGIGDPRSS